MPKKPPRKPSEPLTALVFGGRGRRTYMKSEGLPDVKEDLELAIASKFVGALRAMGRDLEALKRIGEWPDFEACERNQRVGVELVEVINSDHARKRARQEQYLKALLPLVQDMAPTLVDVSMTIVDGYQDPAWPPVTAVEGQRLVDCIVRNLRADIDEIRSVRSPPGLLKMWTLEGSTLRVGIMAMRGRPIAGSEVGRIDLRFSGAFPMAEQTSHALLAATVAQKITKRYASYEHGPLWLLAYSETPFLVDPSCGALAKEVLRQASHPFSEVWAFFPFPSEDAGALVHVFP